MNTVTRLPNIQALIDPILGEPYATWDCWALLRYLLKEGLDFDVTANQQEAAQQIREVWFKGDARDPQSLMQPWDVFIMATGGLVSDHLALVVDPMTLVHTRRATGVCQERIRKWRPWLLQLARLRVLM